MAWLVTGGRKTYIPQITTKVTIFSLYVRAKSCIRFPRGESIGTNYTNTTN